MIVIDTHVWVWWVHHLPELKPRMRSRIVEGEPDGIGVSGISCWEIAQLVTRGRVDVGRPLADRFADALAYPGLRLLGLTPAVATESVQLPGEFHKDPADRFAVATARLLSCPLRTVDQRAIDYAHVQIVRP